MRRPRRPKYPWSDFINGRARKEKGIKRVLDNAGDWTPRAQQIVLQLCAEREGEEMLGEDISKHVTDRIGMPPNHSNALGGLGNWYVMRGLVIEVFTERPDHMRKPSSHARRTPRYRLVHPRSAVPKKRRGDDDSMAAALV